MRNGRANTRFLAGRFADAAADYSGLVERSPYYALLRYLARARAGEFDSAELRRNTERLDRKMWPWPIIAVYLGEMKREKLRDWINERDHEQRACDEAFYIGEYSLTRRRRDEALAWLQQAAKTCEAGAVERDVAESELRRLQTAAK